MVSEDEIVVSKLKKKLAKSGFLQNAKARLSSEILMELKGIMNIPTKRPRNLKDQAIRCLILDYLKKENMEYSRSTFESEICSHSEIAIEEILGLFGIPEHSLDLMQSFHDDQHSLLYCLMTSIGNFFEGRKHKGIHLQTVSTQTASTSYDLISTRDSLRENLSYIEEKHRNLTTSSNFRNSSSLEQHLFQFQKECESRERILMEKKLENFKRDIVSRLQMEESARHRKEINRLKDELNQDHERAIEALQEQSTVQKMNMEQKHLEEIKRLTKEVDTLKRNERENITFLEMERRKLQLDEQRCKQMFKTADFKLKLIETKEEELRESVKAEYKKCREEAKQSYEELLDSAKKQEKMYSDGLEELNSLRRMSTENLMKSEIASTEASKLRVQNKSLQHEINQMNKEMKELRISSNMSSESSSDEITSLKSSIVHLQQDLDEAHRELSILKSTEINSSRCFKDMYDDQQQKLKEALHTLERIKVEKVALIGENQELRQLLESTQNTLLSLHSKQLWIEHHASPPLKFQEQKRALDKSINREEESAGLQSLVENKLVQLKRYSVIRENGGSDTNQTVPFDHDAESGASSNNGIATTQSDLVQSDPNGSSRDTMDEHSECSVTKANQERSHEQNQADISCNESENDTSIQMEINRIETQASNVDEEILKDHGDVSTNCNTTEYKIIETEAELRLSPIGMDKDNDRQSIHYDDSYHSDFDSE